MSKPKKAFKHPTALHGIGKAYSVDVLKNGDKLFFLRPVLENLLRNLSKRVVRVSSRVDDNILAYRERQLSACLAGALEDDGAAVIPEWPFQRRLPESESDRYGRLDFWARLPSTRVDRKHACIIGLEVKQSFLDPTGGTIAIGEVHRRKWRACVRQIRSLRKGVLSASAMNDDDRRIKVALHAFIFRVRSKKEWQEADIRVQANEFRKVQTDVTKKLMSLKTKGPAVHWAGTMVFGNKYIRDVADPFRPGTWSIYPGFALVMHAQQYTV